MSLIICLKYNFAYHVYTVQTIGEHVSVCTRQVDESDDKVAVLAIKMQFVITENAPPHTDVL